MGIDVRPLIVLSVNQDRGIGPERAKGAAVHLVAMREAFAELGADCRGLDEADDESLVAKLQHQLKKGPVDLIYERYALGKSVASHFAVEHGIPLVLEVNAPLADEHSRWRGGVSDESEDTRQDAFAMAAASQVIAVSSEVAAYAIKRGANAGRVEVFPNGIDKHRFKPSIRDESMRQALVPPGRFVIGFHGRVRPWHGFDTLVNVCHKLLAKGLDIHLLVVGEGDFDELERLPDDRYTRVQWQAHEDIPKYVAAFDVLPLTYRADMPCYFSPLKLMEAMGCGVVPLVPDLGDLPETIKHQQTGLVYPAGDEKALLTQLEWLITDKSLLESIGHRAAEQASQHSWARIANFVLEAASSQQGTLDQALQKLQKQIPDLQQIRRVAIERQGDIYFEAHERNKQRFFVYDNGDTSELLPADDRKIPLAARLSEHDFAASHSIISYRPGRRIVLGAVSGQKGVFLKGYKKRRAAAAFECYKIAVTASKKAGFVVPELLWFEAEVDCLVTAELPGQPPIIGMDATDVWTGIGMRLKHFQQAMPVEDLQTFSSQHELDVLDERARRFLLCNRTLPSQWKKGRDRLQEIFENLAVAVAGLAHRDLHDGQFVIDGKDIGLLDFDLLCCADVALDAGNLLAHIKLRALQHTKKIPDAAVAVCSSAFLQGLARQQESGFEQRLYFYQASTFYRLALLYAIRPRWSQLVPALINEGQRYITLCNDLQKHL